MRKSTLRTWHRRIGLSAAFFLGVQGLTGAIIAWRDELLEVAAARVAPVRSGLAVDAILAAGSARHPAMSPTRLDLPGHVGGPAMLRLVGSKEADRLLFFAPATGAVLSDAVATSYPGEVAYQLHTRFLAGPNGRWIIVVDAILLVSMAVTGLWFWWPGRRHVRRALGLRMRGPAHRLVAEMHRVLGATLSLALGLIATTGLMLALLPEAAKLLGADAAPASRGKPTGDLLSVDLLLAEARRAAPTETMRSLRFSGPALRTIRVVFAAGSPHRWSVDDVWIDRADGRITAIGTADDAAPAKAVLSWMLPLHAWRWAGGLGQLFATLLGLALFAFAASGSWLWARRFTRRPNPHSQS